MKNAAFLGIRRLLGIRKALVASFLALGALLPSQADSIRRGYYNGWGYIVTFSCSAVLCPAEIGEAAVSGKLYLYFAPNTKKKFKGAVRVVEVNFPLTLADPDVDGEALMGLGSLP